MTISLEEWKEKKTKSKDEGFTLTIANAVCKYLDALIDDRPKRRTRWIWELLQNAHDASIASDKRLVASIRDNSEELIFLHNGSGFTIEQIQRLIFHGSTKVEDEETIGRYGSGFLTTHLLSWDIDVSGQLDNDQWFDFRLSRNPESVNALSASMNQAWDDFNPVTSLREPMPERFTTRFKYPITEIWAKDAVQEGNTTLKQCAPFVVVFNKAFYSIDINEPGEISSFKVGQRCLSIRSGLWEINVIQSINENQTEMKYLLAQGKKASVTVPLRSIGDRLECLSVENIPRLFVAFPLMGTESFSFPAVINGNRKFLKPNENRDGVDLGQGNQLDSNTNRNNQAVIKEACALLAHLFRHATSHSWYHAYQWADVPTTQTNEWLRKCIKEKFIENILQTPAILTEFGKVIMPKDARLPLAVNDKGVSELWGLLNDLHEYHEKLPRKNEAKGWCNTIKNWAKLNECEVSDLPDVGVDVGIIDGRELAGHIENECSCLKDLQNLLRENVCAVDWLNRFYKLLEIYEINAVIDDYVLVPDQNGEFDLLDNLSCDKDIDDELKEIAALLNRPLRGELRDSRLTSLAEKTGAGDLDNENVVKDLIDRLQERADNNPDNDFQKASRFLFAWIVNKKDYTRLRHFPVFAEDMDSDEPKIIQLPHPTQDNASDNERPLAPIRSWANDLQDYSELFPRQHILANVFFETVPDPDIWQTLEEKGYIRKDVIIRDHRKVLFETFLPYTPLTEDMDHESEEEIIVTDIAFLTKKDIGIIDRVRKSPRLARKFWYFLTEWLIVHDPKAVEIIDKLCTCKETHYCYPAEWLVPVVSRKWVPLDEKKADKATAESIANLLRGSDWDPGTLSENDPICNLLEAIGVPRLNLMRETFVDNNDREEVDNAIIEMIRKTEGDASRLNQATEYIEALKDDEDLPNIVAKHQDRKRTIKENKNFGDQVEEIVGLILKNQGYSVKDIHKGADFKISELTEDSEDTDTLTTLTVTDKTCGREWLIEVKSARTESVKMSFAQANTAVEYGENFLLCVVPMKPENTELNLEEKKKIVRENIQFIKNIGTHIDRLLADRNALEGLRTDATVDNGSGVRLVYETGTTGIRVDHSVWENEGFPLGDLAENLE